MRHYGYEDVPTVAEFSECNDFVRGLMGPFGSGKSAGCTVEIMKHAAKQPVQEDGKRRARYAVIRNTYPQLRDTTIKTVLQWLPDGEVGTYLKSDHMLLVNKLDPTLEVEIIFRALDRPEHVSNLLSLELTGAWVNEAREVPWAVIEALQGRVGRYPARIDGGCTDPQIWMDTNPPDDESWWYKKFEEERPEGWALFKQPPGDGPHAENLANLPDGYYERMRSMDRMSYQVYVQGQYGFLRDGKPCYPDYVDDIHCREFEPNFRNKIYGGWDFGLTPAFALVEETAMGQVRVFQEYTSDGIYFPDFVEEVISRVSRDWPELDLFGQVHHIGDPAGEQRSAVAKNNDEATCFAVAKQHGIRIRPGKQAVSLRLGSVGYAMRRMNRGQPVYQVHPRCKMIRRGNAGRYQFRRIQVPGEERYTEEPDKNQYSHIQDGKQYVFAELFAHMLADSTGAKKGAKPKIQPPSLGVR